MTRGVAIFMMIVQTLTAATLVLLILDKQKDARRPHVDQYEFTKDACVLREVKLHPHYNRKDIAAACDDEAQKEILK